jgi:TonB family protein
LSEKRALRQLAQGPKFVSSATNIVQPGAGGKEGNGSPRPNPVAFEVLVSVTGAKASPENGSRDLFSEETTTVLVFIDGAVIRLAAPVNVGQLLFLTNKKSNHEVVCQVLHKKSFKPGSNYVELLFTEERTDYWGVTFPEQRRAPEFRVAEQVSAEEVTSEAPEETVQPHTAEDVDLLKQEVEALREQLVALQKNQVAEAAAAAMAEAEAAREKATREAAKAPEALAGNSFKGKEEAAALHAEPTAPAHPETPKEEDKPALLMPTAAKDQNDVARAVINMALPVWKMEKSPEEQLLEEESASEAKRKAVEQPVEELAVKPAEEASEELLPKPALDFSQAPKGGLAVAAGARGAGSGKARMLGLGAVLALALAGGAWYGKWWELLPIGKVATVANSGNVARPVVRKATDKLAAGSASAAGASGAAAPQAHGGTVKDSAPDAKSGATDGPTNGKNVEGGAANGGAWNTEESARKSGRGKSKEDAKATAAPPSSTADEVGAAESVAGDAPVVAAKLLKAANPVYPPDAMRSYITGDIKAEVVVQASGRVGKVTVISGPKALQTAAVEALKQYEYAPATQGGKAVESKTEEVVKFWFNP